MQACKCFNQERLIFGTLHPTEIADYAAIVTSTPCAAHLIPSTFTKAELGDIDSIGYDRKGDIIAKKPLACIGAARNTVGWINIGKRPQRQFHEVALGFSLAHGRMAVSNAHRDTSLLGDAKRKHRKRVDMTVNYIPLILFEQRAECFLITSKMLIRRHLKETTAQILYLLIWNNGRVGINYEIKLHFTPVNMAVIVHDNGLNASANHLANDLGHPNWFSHLTSTATGKDLNDREENDL